MTTKNLNYRHIIIDGDSKYEIFQIVNSKINYRYIYKLPYKVVWLGYKNMEEESDQLFASKFVYTPEVVFDFYLTYPNKSSLFSLP